MNEYLTKRKHTWLLNLWRDSEDYEWSGKGKSETYWGTIFINLIDKQLVGISNGDHMQAFGFIISGSIKWNHFGNHFFFLKFGYSDSIWPGIPAKYKYNAYNSVHQKVIATTIHNSNNLETRMSTKRRINENTVLCSKGYYPESFSTQ